MPFDSNGIWSLTAGYQAITGQTILPLNHNPPLEDIRDNGLSAVLVRDGRAPMTGPLNMNTNKITNLATGTAGTDAATVAQIPSLSGILAGFRNKIINGDFFIWQRATTQTTNGYGGDDRWLNSNVGSTKTASQQPHTIGQTSVPGNPSYFKRTVVASVAGASNLCSMTQNIESVLLLSGLDVTVTFWAKADASRNIAIEMVQAFGTGGSPSAPVTGIGSQLIPLNTSWQKITKKITVPSISGKTVGTNSDHSTNLIFWFDAGSSFNARTANLGQQSGTFDISHVSVVVGDATSEADPFSPRHIQQELALCQRYYQSIQMQFSMWSGVNPMAIQYTQSLMVAMRAVPAATVIAAGTLSGFSTLNPALSAQNMITNGTTNVVGAVSSFNRMYGLDAEI